MPKPIQNPVMGPTVHAWILPDGIVVSAYPNRHKQVARELFKMGAMGEPPDPFSDPYYAMFAAGAVRVSELQFEFQGLDAAKIRIMQTYLQNNIEGIRKFETMSIDDLNDSSYIPGILVHDFLAARRPQDVRKLGRPQRVRNPASDEADLSVYLAPKGKVASIGPETGRPVNNGIAKFQSQHGSIRYVAYSFGKPTSVLQVVTMDNKTATIANVFTVEGHRHQGLAAKLLARARKDFKSVEHSKHLTRAGSAWARKVNPAKKRRSNPEWGDFIRGEYWIHQDGDIEGADLDVGDKGHEAIAIDRMLDKDELLKGLIAYYQSKAVLKNGWSEDEALARADELSGFLNDDEMDSSNILAVESYIPDKVGAAAAGGAKVWADLKEDARVAYAKHGGGIQVVDTNFFAWKVTKKTIERIIDFLHEMLDGEEDVIEAKDRRVFIEEGSTKKHAGPTVSELLEVNSPRGLWALRRSNPAGVEEDEGWFWIKPDDKLVELDSFGHAEWVEENVPEITEEGASAIEEFERLGAIRVAHYSNFEFLEFSDQVVRRIQKHIQSLWDKTMLQSKGRKGIIILSTPGGGRHLAVPVSELLLAKSARDLMRRSNPTRSPNPALRRSNPTADLHVDYYNPEEDDQGFGEQAWSLAKGSEINILSDKDLKLVAIADGRVVGAVFDSMSRSEDGYDYSFDTIVDPTYRGRRIGSMLMDAGLEEFANLESEVGARLVLDVVNPMMVEALRRRGLDVKLRSNPTRSPNPAPVKVDHEEIKRLAKRLRNQYIRALELEFEEVYIKKVRFPAVGGAVELDVQLNIVPRETRGGISGAVIVHNPGRPGKLPTYYYMQINLIGPWDKKSEFLLKEIERVLLHEATHVGRLRYMMLTKYHSLPASPTDSDIVKYANHPEEVEARAQEIAADTLIAARNYNDNPQRYSSMTLDDLMGTSNTWRNYEQYLSEPNKRLIREKVARVVVDAGEIAPGAARRPPYKRKHELLDTLTIGILEDAAYPVVSKSAQAFHDALKKVKYDFRKMPLEYMEQRDRILSAYHKQKGWGGLWDKDGKPTRKHLELIMWAFTPHRDRLDAYVNNITSSGTP